MKQVMAKLKEFMLPPACTHCGKPMQQGFEGNLCLNSECTHYMCIVPKHSAHNNHYMNKGGSK